MRSRRILERVSVLVALSVALIAAPPCHAKKKAKAEEYALTQIELQIELMSFADRFASLSAQAIDDTLRLDPTPEARRALLGDLVYSMAATYTIAANADAEVALLDTLVLTTLGHQVFRDYWRPRLGECVEPAIRSYATLSEDIWRIAGGLLSEPQKSELLERIEAFRQTAPELSAFSHLRFADFPSKRTSSSLVKGKSGGMFKSVGRITEQVELTRLLAERGIFLSTRLPLLSGFFADVWLSQLSGNPEVELLLQDLHEFSSVAERMATAAERMPEDLARERKNALDQVARETAALEKSTIDRLMAGIAEQRELTIRQLLDEEDTVTGVLGDLRQTLMAGNELLLSAGSLTEKLGLEAAAAQPGEPSEPLDIEAYRETLVQLTAVIEQLNTLVGSTDQLIESPVIERAEGFVDRVFRNAALLVLLFLVGCVIAMLAYRALARMLFRSGT